jgi:heme A synthase
MDVSINPAFVIFAAISPLIIALVKQQKFSTQVNALIAFACYIVFGVLGALTSGLSFTLDNVVAFITVGTLVGTAVYNVVYSNLMTGSDGTADSLDTRLTAATSLLKG